MSIEKNCQKYALLDAIDSPDDLKKLELEQLPQLCQEMRDFMVDNISLTGGHFASNLGSVELAVALHYVFSTPTDQIVWDTGHQAYPHKILTGRRKDFERLRKYKGLSGYPTPEESPHDAYPVGHAGTSISVALGLARARDLQHKENQVIGVIGDGAMTSGLALEGLNNAHGTKKFMVILNDNEMSISPTIGAFAKHFSILVASPRYRFVKHNVGILLSKIWLIGPPLVKIIMRLQGGIKHILAPQNLFENLGYHYLGPISAHDVVELVKMLKSCQKDCELPVLLHLISKKGKGYAHAETKPEIYHGVSPFDKKTGEFVKAAEKNTYTNIISKAIQEIAQEDERVVVVSAAMCGGTGMTEFAEKFPERFVDVGIAEQHAVTFAGGMASQGMRPIVGIYSTFMQRAYDQIEHDICLADVPAILALDRSGLVGSDGKTHHGVFDIAYLRHLPNIKIFMPRDHVATKKILEYALSQDKPCVIRYPRRTVPYHITNQRIPDYGMSEVTSWERLKEGEDLTIVAIGHMVYYAYKAAEILQEKGIKAAVVDGCAIKPLDLKTLKEISKNKIVTLEDHVLAGGFGSAIGEAILDNNFQTPLLRIGIPDNFVEHGSLDELYTELGWQPEQLAATIEKWIK